MQVPTRTYPIAEGHMSLQLQDQMAKANALQAEEAGYGGFWSAVGQSWLKDQVFTQFHNYLMRPDEADPDFKVTPGLLMGTAQDLTLEDQQDLTTSTSMSEYVYRLNNIKSVYDHRQQMGHLGGGGIGASILAGALDPVYLAATALTFGVAGGPALAGRTGLSLQQVAQFGNRASHIKGLFRGGALAAATVAPIETSVATVSDTAEFKDVPFAIVSAALAGGVIGGAFPRTAYSSKWLKLRDEMVAKDVKALVTSGAATKTVRGEVQFPDDDLKAVLTPTELAGSIEETKGLIASLQEGVSRGIASRNKMIDDSVAGMSDAKVRAAARQRGIALAEGTGRKKTAQLREELTSVLKAEALQDEGVQRNLNRLRGAKRLLRERENMPSSRLIDGDDGLGLNSNTDEILRRMDQTDPMSENIGEKLFGFLNGLPIIGAMSGQALNSANAGLRKFGSIFMEDGLLRTKYPLVAVAAQKTDAAMARLNQQLHPHYKTLMAGVSKVAGGNKRMQVDRLIARAIRSGETPDGALGEAVTVIRNHLKETLAHGKKMGVFDESIPDDPRFLPRHIVSEVARAIDGDMGEEWMVDFLTESLINGSKMAGGKPLKESLARRLAARYRKMAMDPDDYVSLRAHSSEEWSKIAAELRQTFGKELDEAGFDVEDFVGLIAPKADKKTLLGSNRKRLQFDEMYEKDGITFDQMLNNDLGHLLEIYTKRVIGAGEWKAGLKALAPDEELVTVGDLKAWLRKSTGHSKEGRATEDKFADTIYRSMMGLPLSDQATINKWTRRLMDLQFVRVMNQVGFAQVPELYNAVAMNGLVASLKAIPALNILRKRAADGKLDRALLAEIEAATGIGADVLRRLHINRMEVDMDFAGSGIQSAKLKGRAALGAKYDRIMAGARGITYLNPVGLGPMDMALRRFAAEGAVQNWVNQAFKVRKGVAEFKDSWKSKSRSRLKDLGFDDDEVDALMVQLSKEGVVEVQESVLGGFNVKKLNLDKWDDQLLADKFSTALYRHVNRVIQRTEVSTVSPWMNHPLGRVAVQFRTFAFTSFQKQLGYNMRRADASSANMMIGTAVFGSLAYYAQQQARAFGMRPAEREEFLYESLSLEKMISNGIMRAGWTSLMPSGITTVQDLAGYEPWFTNYGRSTGLGTGMVNGIPAVDFFNDIGKSAGSIFSQLAGNSDWSQADSKNLWKSIPLNNLLGLDNFFNRLNRESPFPLKD